MNLYSLLTKDKGSLLSRNNGATPTNIAPNSTSKLHYSYSINGTPNYPDKPAPSILDREGITPKKYLDTIMKEISSIKF